MNHNWILDVLADLRGFAATNGMDGLAEHLDDAMLIAAAEMAGDRGVTDIVGHDAKTGIRIGAAAGGRNH